MSKKIYYSLLGLIFALAFIHCLNEIENKNMWFDEVYSWNLSLDAPKEIIAIASGDMHPPLFYITLKFWTNLFSDSVLSMRLFSALLVLGGMFWTYKICRLIKITDKKTLLVLLLYAFSPLLIYYAQEVRMQCLNLFLTLGSTFFFLKFLQTGRNIFAIVWVILSALSLYTHYFALLILFSQILILAVGYLRKQTNWRFALSGFLFSLLPLTLFSPWIPVFFRQTGQGQPWRVPLTSLQVLENFLSFFREIFFSNYWNYENSAVIKIITWFSIILILFLIVSAVSYIIKSERRKVSIIILFFIPSIIAVLISFRQSIVFSRYLIIIVPYLLILCTYFIFRINKKYISYPLYLILLSASAYGLSINFNNDYKNNDYRKIEAFIENNSGANDRIIVDPHYLGWIIKYDAWHGKTKLYPPEVLGWNLQMQLDSLSRRNDLRNLWMVLDYASMEKNGYDSLNQKMSLLGYKTDSLKEKTFYLYPNKVKTSYFYK